MFNSLPQTWINVTTHHSDFKELVPQFYMPETKVTRFPLKIRLNFKINYFLGIVPHELPRR